MTLSELERYNGGDADLEISLREYGLIWKTIEEEKFFFDPRDSNGLTLTSEVEFIFGIDFGEVGYITFDTGTMSKKEFIELLKESWINLPGLLLFCDRSYQGLIDDFPSSISVLIDYHGYQNIFGGSACPFMIE